MGTQITHKHSREEDRMVQIVPPEVLRQILDADGDNYERPDDFGPDDEWNV